jgi:hypothetical protein
MNADGRKKKNISDGHCSYLTSSSSLSISQLAQCPWTKKISPFLFGYFPISFFFSSRLFLFFMYMLVTDGHMCQNWHRWEEWWRPSTVTWERKTIRIQCVHTIRQTKRVKGTWQIFELNEKKKIKSKWWT